MQLFECSERLNVAVAQFFYTGIEKSADPIDHQPNNMMFAILREVIKRLDQYCIDKDAGFIIFLDHRDDRPLRDALVTVTQQEMFGNNPKWTLLEAPTQVESHRYQLVQVADWMCGLIGRIEAYKTHKSEYPDFDWTEKYFVYRLNRLIVRSGIRKQHNVVPSTLLDLNEPDKQ